MESVFDGGLIRTMNPDLLRDWAHTAVDGLETLRGEINDLNVFPIPDSDTGSNMLFTMQAAADALGSLPADASTAAVARAMADAAVAQARGNSGIILSQVLMGLADAAELMSDEAQLTFNHLWSAGLRLGSLAAVRAVSDPREGTVLTLIRTAAVTAGAHVSESAGDLARAVADDCADALERTPEQLPELAEAGVVDAGGRGFLALADAMVAVLTGVAQRRRRYRGILIGGGEPGHQDNDTCSGGSDMDFEVMYVLDGAAGEKVGSLRKTLNDIGDSVVIVGDSSSGGERFSVHVHTSDPGKAVEAGVVRGPISEVRISCFALDALRAQADSAEPPPRHKRAVIAAVTGEGADELFTEAGAAVVRADDGLTPDALTAAIRAADSAHVVVMANGKLSSQDLVSVTAATRSAQRSVVFLPTSSMVQCLSALAVHDPTEAPDPDTYAMAEAAAGTRWGSLVRADSRIMTLAGTSEVGDVLGMIGSDVLVIAPDQTGAATALVDLMLATGGEMVTVMAGAGVDDSALDALTEQMRRSYAGVELAIYRTGQADQLMQVGVE
ncbi:DAK2 domain-containing protein [Gordonia sp. PKS22-38]|uniref:DAK2 domain-containing protein n=1 Tax=Gordonia prachuapensis TaxID=3115651 RepID=A0ABU7MWJ6_9ACTN|nr:DAK2 domain-containing protein [Gordonia sp. PKS22-38]